jgi:hypothetical protein
MGRVLILTGAGACADGGIPTTLELTRRLDEALLVRRDEPILSQVYRYVVGGLLMAKGLAGGSPFEGLNVEEVFSAVDLLARRDGLEAAPFIGSWHTGVQSLDHLPPDVGRLSDAICETVDTALMAASRSGVRGFRGANPRLQQAFKEAVLGVTEAASGAVFRFTANAMLDSLTSLITVEDPSRLTYLAPLLQFAVEEGATIATLNYDLALEAVAEASGITYSDGTDEWKTRRRIVFPSDALPIMKIHGSLGWHFGADTAPPELLFGTRAKLRAEGPFLDLLLGFREALREATVLLVVGYSFRDDHVNHYISDWQCQTPDSHLVVVNRTFPNPVTHPLHRTLADYVSIWGDELVSRIEGNAAGVMNEAIERVRERMLEVKRSDRVRCTKCGRLNPPRGEQCASCAWPLPRTDAS